MVHRADLKGESRVREDQAGPWGARRSNLVARSTAHEVSPSGKENGRDLGIRGVRSRNKCVHACIFPHIKVLDGMIDVDVRFRHLLE